MRPHRLARPRTPPFQGGNTGSNPVGDAKILFSFLYVASIKLDTPGEIMAIIMTGIYREADK